MIGIDLVKISRIDEIINNKGLDFAQKMVGSDADKAETLAGHYAVKEAFAKVKPGENAAQMLETL